MHPAAGQLRLVWFCWACFGTLDFASSYFQYYRLDFEELTTKAPTTQGICTPDYFQATGAATGTTQGSTGNLSPKICGVNTGKTFC